MIGYIIGALIGGFILGVWAGYNLMGWSVSEMIKSNKLQKGPKWDD